MLICYGLGMNSYHMKNCVRNSCAEVSLLAVMDLETRIQLVELYFANGNSASAALRAYKVSHGYHRDPFSASTISRLIQRFRETGSVKDKPRSGRPNLEEERKVTVAGELEAQQSNPELGAASCRSIARRTGVPKTSVQQILRHRLHLYPYRLQTNQTLTVDDKENRVSFARFLLSGVVDLESILWSDESYFSISGRVNRHNSIVWGSEKPREVIETDIHAPKVCVWFGYSAQYRLTPFFFPSTVTGENYRNMLRDHVIPQIRRHHRMDSTVFQQDGAPPHFSTVARSFLSSVFPNDRIIARGFPNRWPAHSPDLTPLDYYFWGVVKDRVYHCFKPASINELREKIITVIENIDSDELRRSILNLPSRLAAVIECQGDAIEHYL